MKINYTDYITLKELSNKKWFPYFNISGAYDTNGNTFPKEFFGMSIFQNGIFQAIHFRDELYNNLFVKTIRSLITRNILIIKGVTSNGDNVFGLCEDDVIWLSNNIVPYSPPKLSPELSSDELSTLHELAGEFRGSFSKQYRGTIAKQLSGSSGSTQLQLLMKLIHRGYVTASNSLKTYTQENPMITPPTLLKKVSRHFSGERFSITEAGLKFLFNHEINLLNSLTKCPINLLPFEKTINEFLINNPRSLSKPMDALWDLVFHSTRRNNKLEKYNFDISEFSAYSNHFFDQTLSFSAHHFCLDDTNVLFVLHLNDGTIKDFKILADVNFSMNHKWEEFFQLFTTYLNQTIQSNKFKDT